MTIWIIEPRDPLIVRDGRPFGPNPGARAATLPFPFPSTVVGGLRHKAGLDAPDGEFDRSEPTKKAVLELGLRGPLLAELNDDDNDTATIKQFLFPAPADALALDPDAEQQPEGDASRPADTQDTAKKDQIRIQRLAPRTFAGAPTTNQPDDLALIGPAHRLPNKVSGKAPRFWNEQRFMNWLGAPHEDTMHTLADVGIGALETDARTHVSVTPETQTAREGALFQTRGLEFTWRDLEAAKEGKFTARRLALVAAFEQNAQPYVPQHFNGGLAPLGGERRLMRWCTSEGQLPAAPAGLFDAIVTARCCRVILLTPAIFGDGYRPALQWVRGGVTATLKAAAVPRMQVVSGWDLAAKGGRGSPKRTRRLAPAGSVYFIEWGQGADVRAWLDATWLQNISDDNQDCRDGFGLAVVGVWPNSDKEQQR